MQALETFPLDIVSPQIVRVDCYDEQSVDSAHGDIHRAQRWVGPWSKPSFTSA